MKTDTSEECRERAHQRLLKYKKDLELELLRVTASLEDATEENFKLNGWLGLDKPKVSLIQRKTGAGYVRDSKGGPDPGAREVTSDGK